MGEHYNFQLDPKEPSAEQIAKHKDFEALLQAYQQSEVEEPARVVPFYRKPRSLAWAGFLAIAASFALLLVFRFNAGPASQEELLAEADAYFAEQPFINPPLPDLNPPFQKTSISAAKGGEYKINQGLKMVVPEYAFMDDRGRQIEGEVEVSFREMHDPVDFFLSGIPMTYEDQDQRFQMESAGMVEVYGAQNGRTLQIAPNKKIRIELISRLAYDQNLDLADFQIYYLDTMSRGWLPGKRDMVEWYQTPAAADFSDKQTAISRLEEDENALINLVLGTEPKLPQKTFERSADDITIDLDFIQDDNITVDPETENLIKSNEDGIWRIAKNQDINTQAFAVEWEQVELRKLDTYVYNLSLIKGTTRQEIKIQPVLIGEELAKAEAAFSAEMATYRSAYEAWEVQKNNRVAALRDSFQVLKNEWISSTQADEVPNDKARIKSSFEIDAFGVWNCDRLIEWGETKIVDGFKGPKGQNYQAHTAYLIDKNHNTLYQFYASDQALLTVPTDEDLLVWIVDEKDQLVLRKEEKGRDRLVGAPIEPLELLLEVKSESSETELRALLLN